MYPREEKRGQGRRSDVHQPVLATAGTAILGFTDAARSADNNPAEGSSELLSELKSYPHQVVYETNRDGNWELYLCNADGSHSINLTRTPNVDELYPKPSPDGSHLAFAMRTVESNVWVLEEF